MFGRFFEVLQSGIRRRPAKLRDEVYPGPSRGVVVRVLSGEDAGAQVEAPHQVICDVLMARGGIVRAPVMQRGSSVSNVSRWVPTPARTNMTTGAAIKLVNDGLAPPPSSIDDLDGEVVLVDWMEGSIERPVIIGSLEHPRGQRRSLTGYSTPAPTAPLPVRMHSDLAERFLGHQGTTLRVDRAGCVRLDLRRAGVANDGQTYDAQNEAAGNLDVSLRDQSELLVRGPSGLPLFRVRAQGDEILLDIGAAPAERILLAGPTLDHLQAWWTALNDLGQRVDAIWQVVSAAALAADVSGAPAPVEILPGTATLLQSWEWVPPQDTGAAGPGMQSALVRIGAASLEGV